LIGVQETDRLKEVYATDDETLSLSAGPKSSYVGHVIDKVDTDQAIIRLGELGDLPADDVARQVEYFEDFLGAQINTTDGRWKTVDVGDATQGLVADAHGGEVALALAATSEAEDAVLYHGDTKNFDIDSKLIFECRAKVTTPGSGVTVVFGVAGDHNLDKDSISQHAWFRLQAGLDLLAESDDGTNDNDDVDTLLNLVSGTYYTFRIDLTDPSDVKFYVDTARLLSTSTFDMSNFSGRLQPYFSVDKASGTGTATLTVDWVKLTATRA
ncbi:MAG: LamG domain-containing protein, partial [Planctomycetota bacterium]